jgi:flagellum-specific peptidoglycan hydrolase FlgJ
MAPSDFLARALLAAKAAGHVWPEYAACEAALESAWGGSLLAVKCNNLFGQKEGHSAAGYPHVAIATHEWDKEKKAFVPAEASWPIFPDWETAFRERMTCLQSARFEKSGALIYAAALAAYSGDSFIRLVSLHWATDPQRANKVLEIYNAHRAVLQSLTLTQARG